MVIAHTTANTSPSYEAYRFSCSFSERDANSIGTSVPVSSTCERLAPSPKVEKSVAKINGLLGTGKRKLGIYKIYDLIVSNAYVHLVDHSKLTFAVSYVSGATIDEKLQMNFL